MMIDISCTNDDSYVPYLYVSLVVLMHRALNCRVLYCIVSGSIVSYGSQWLCSQLLVSVVM
jgi:hypothetical protein